MRTDDPKWSPWSADALRVPGFVTVEELEQLLPRRFDRLELPYEAAFLAGKVLLAVR